MVFEKTVKIPEGRFVGPVEISVPRKADDPFVVYEIHTTLTAACAPRLRVSFPDGEAKGVGPRAQRWQELLARRAEGVREAAKRPSATAAGAVAPDAKATEAASAPPPEPVPDAPVEPPPEPSSGGEGVELSAEVDISARAEAQPAPPSGRWQRVTTDSWPGQREYLALRAKKCARRRTYTYRYDTAFDESGRIAIWAEVPQDIRGGSLSVKVVKAVDVEDRREYIAELEEQERERAEKIARRRRKRERKAAKRRARAERPRPPRPPPKRENPGRPQACARRSLS